MFHIIGKLIRFVIGLTLLIVLGLIVVRTFGFSPTDISNKFSGITSAVETKKQQAVDVVDKTKSAADSIGDTFSKITEALDSLKKVATTLTTQKPVASSTAVIHAKEQVKTNPDTSITVDSIIELTNAERQKAGKSKLTHNTKPDAAAELKVNDLLMFQYFERWHHPVLSFFAPPPLLQDSTAPPFYTHLIFQRSILP